MPESRSDPSGPDHSKAETPANQTDESQGRIKQPQHNPEKNLPRGSEPETHARK